METILFQGSPMRIDLRLTQQFPYSRNFFHHLLSRDAVLVNSKPCKKSYQLKSGDEVTVQDFSRFLDGGILEETPIFPLDIRYEADDYLILYKPKGVLSHPNSIRDVQQPSVVGALWHHFKSLPSYTHFIRAGLLHRLDKETDGLMVIAKTERGLSHFKDLFQRKSEAISKAEKEAVPLHKYYRALCHLTEGGKAFVDSLILPSYIEEIVYAKVPNATPKMGITKILGYSVADNKQTVAVELEILTGRTHQIRYHLAHHGLPIVGDYLYGKEETPEMQLTAWKLCRQDLDGVERFSALSG